jgi:hypothetical protein
VNTTNGTNDQIPHTHVGAPFSSRSFWLWAGLLLFSGIPRILGAFLLPNAFGDAYTYLDYIEAMRSKMADGTFAIKDLHGFWFPLYQFVCAAASLLFGHTFYVAKLVSALCGIGVCLLVYQISMRLTDHRPLSLLAFALAAINPLHVFYSSSSMTDIPHGFLVMASLYFALEKRWKVAAIFAAAAGFMRVESWMLIVLLPALQFLFQRRVSLAALGIITLSPLFWFYICWKATGSALAYFEMRNQYLAEYTAANPAITIFSPQRLRLDTSRLLVSTNLVVLCSCIAAVWMILRRMMAERVDWRKFRTASLDFTGVTAINVFFFSNLGFLVLAYFTGSQPEIWSRYGLIFFTLGLPVMVWTFLVLSKRRSKIIVATVSLAIFAFHTKDQIREMLYCASEETAKSVIAAYIKEVYKNDPSLRIYCEDGGVRFLTGLPRDKFVTSYNLPADREAFLKRFDENGVKYAVCSNWDASITTTLFPGLREGKGGDAFQEVVYSPSKRSSLKLWIYRVR